MMINALYRVWQVFHVVFSIWSYSKYLFIQSLPNSRPSSLKHIPPQVIALHSGVESTTLVISYFQAVSFSWSPNISTHTQSSGMPHLQCRDGGRRAQCLHTSRGLSPLSINCTPHGRLWGEGSEDGKDGFCDSFLSTQVCKPWSCVNHGPKPFSSAVFMSGSSLLQEAALGPTRNDDSLPQYQFLSWLLESGAVGKLEPRETQGRCADALLLV